MARPQLKDSSGTDAGESGSGRRPDDNLQSDAFYIGKNGKYRGTPFGDRRSPLRPGELSRWKYVEGAVFLLFFCGSIPAANWMVGNVGTMCAPDGPCLIPVAPGGIMAPSGVLMVGAALVSRDLVQRRLGALAALGAIAVGAYLSTLFAPTALAFASAAAFLMSEIVDFAIFTPLQRRNLTWAVMLSSIAGSIVDSALFLGLAFGSLDYVVGQVIGKVWAVLLTFPLIAWIRRRDAGRGVSPV